MTCPEKWYDWLLATLHAIVAKDSDTILQVFTNFGPTSLVDKFCYGDSSCKHGEFVMSFHRHLFDITLISFST